MSDKYLNETVLGYFYNRIKAVFATKEEAGDKNVIETIKENGTALTPDAQKAVDITVPTKTSDITNDSNFQNETQVQALIDAELTSVYKPGGTVEFASLPALTKENVGFIYDVTDSFTTTADFVEGAGKTYPAHTNVGIIDKGAAGYFYDVFSGMVDLSGYWAKSELVAMTTAEIDALFE